MSECQTDALSSTFTRCQLQQNLFLQAWGISPGSDDSYPLKPWDERQAFLWNLTEPQECVLTPAIELLIEIQQVSLGGFPCKR